MRNAECGIIVGHSDRQRVVHDCVIASEEWTTDDGPRTMDDSQLYSAFRIPKSAFGVEGLYVSKNDWNGRLILF
jgi:hypothetical protein